jgi:hypothetical protein
MGGVMDEKIAAKLREKFPRELIEIKPQVNCYDCTQAGKAARNARDKHCDRHAVTRCPECKAYITTGHIHLDFVGHASVTDRLLQADPDWTWTPMGRDTQGLPAVDRDGGLWINLTVGGVTKPGYGISDGPGGFGGMKGLIGLAIRNAAMRFGVALDLWSKEELESVHTDATEPAHGQPEPSEPTLAWTVAALRASARKQRPKYDQEQANAYIQAALDARGLDKNSVSDLLKLLDEWEPKP